MAQPGTQNPKSSRTCKVNNQEHCITKLKTLGVCEHNQEHGKFALPCCKSMYEPKLLHSYPYNDLFGAQTHYCLQIKIHGSHPRHTCGQFWSCFAIGKKMVLPPTME